MKHIVLCALLIVGLASCMPPVKLTHQIPTVSVDKQIDGKAGVYFDAAFKNTSVTPGINNVAGSPNLDPVPLGDFLAGGIQNALSVAIKDVVVLDAMPTPAMMKEKGVKVALIPSMEGVAASSDARGGRSDFNMNITFKMIDQSGAVNEDSLYTGGHGTDDHGKLTESLTTAIHKGAIEMEDKLVKRASRCSFIQNAMK
jgi:hypothetical protein